MSGYPRPELLATVEWLAENLGRPELRVLDVRSRPDGTGRAAHAAGHIPGAGYLDWSVDLVARDEESPLMLLAGPDQVAAALGRLGVGGGTTVVLYDDTASLYAARAWWSLRVYGLESARILDGGMAAWTTAGHELSKASLPATPATFIPRAVARMRLSTTDVRSLLGSPDVTLLDARAPAEYRGFEGNTRRLGHIPGAVNVPVSTTTRTRHRQVPAGRRVARPPAQGERHPRSADRLLRRVGGRVGRSSPSCSGCSATTTWPSTTAAGRSGATDSTCRSIADPATSRRRRARTSGGRPTDRRRGAARRSGSGCG